MTSNYNFAIMEKLEKHERELENERTRIMDLMVREHVKSIEDQSGYDGQIDSMHPLKTLEERYKQILQQLQELEKCRNILKTSRIQEESDSQALKDFCSQLESLIAVHCDGLTESSVSRPINNVDDVRDSVEFTPEEEHGKYLDLHECYQYYMKLEHIGEVDYINYLATFDHLFDIPREKKNAEYCQYMKVLIDYLHGYLARVQPLHNFKDELKKAEIKFEKQWQNNTFPGWQRDTKDDLRRNGGTDVQQPALTSWSELKSSLAELQSEYEESAGVDGERVSGTRYGNKVQLTPLEQYEAIEDGEADNISNHKKVATLEAIVYHLLDLIPLQRVATLQKAQQIQGRAIGECADSGNCAYKLTDAPLSVLNPILAPFLKSPMIRITYPQVSTYVPSAFKMYHIIHIMDNIIRKNPHFKRRQDAWHPFISRIYFGIVFILQVTKAEISAGVASIQTKNFHRKFSRHYPPEIIPIPGPLVPLFAQLVPSQSSDSRYGLVTPKLPEALGPTKASTLLNYDSNGAHQLIIPNVPFLVGLMTSITTAQPGQAPDYSDPITFSTQAPRTINGHVFPAEAWNDIEKACLQTAGLLYLAETDEEINENARLFARRLNIPPVDATTNLTTREEYTRLHGDLTWFGDLLAIMTTYCEYFSDSSTLKECKVESSFSSLMTTQYSKLNPDFPMKNLTRAFPASSVFSLDASHSTTEQSVPPEAAMLAESAHLNVVIRTNIPPWDSVGVATRVGPYWQRTPIKFETQVEATYKTEDAVISKYYALTKPQNK